MNRTPLPKQFALDLSHTPKASLENYLPGKDLALISTLKALGRSWNTHNEKTNSHPLNQRWIYWWGPEGSGRTHLLEAMANFAADRGLVYSSLGPNEPSAWVRMRKKWVRSHRAMYLQ